jgi:hypothetical protein
MATITNFRSESADSSGNTEMSHLSGNFSLPFDDPAMINPDELASFPKQVSAGGHLHHDHESHLVNRRTPVREGRNITRTDGFM